MSKQVSRRDFLRWSVIASAGGMVAACAPQAPTTAPPAADPTQPPADAPAQPTATTAAPAQETGGVSSKQAPQFQEMVRAGSLPDLDERLPSKPKVQPAETIGKYGGTLYQASLGVNQYFDMAHLFEMYMFLPNNAGTEIEPDIADSLEFSDDAKLMTIHLRPGVKWSDGAPFTADDIMWRWEEEMGTQGLEHWSDNLWNIGSEKPKVSKVDDFTVTIEFPVPFRPATSLISNWTALQSVFYQPAHFLRNYHIKYTPEVEQQAKDAGFEFWYQYYSDRSGLNFSRAAAGGPTLAPLMITESATTHVVWGRNPYYHVVDTEGNQLPYVDQLYMYVVENRELLKAKAMSGELSTFGAWFTELADMPAYKENESRGNYQAREWIMTTPGALNISFNLTHKDPELRRIFGDVRFRRAMSIAINRQEIIDKLYFGKAEVFQSTVDRNCSFYKEEWGKAYTQYDVDGANAMLDEMGLQWDSNNEWRLREDGRPVTVIVQFQPEFSPSLLEMVKGFWETVGVRTDVKQIQRDLYNTMGSANELDTGVWNSDRMIELRVFQPGVTKFEPNSEMAYAVPWATWKTTGGDASLLMEGQSPPEEPPQEWKDQFALMDRWYSVTNDEDYRTIGQQVWQFFSDQLVLIGLVGYPVQPQIVKNGLMNCPQVANLDDGLNWFKSVHPETFWWDNA
jgi:peptide/nickel transport system substrate-binding protein